MTRLWSTRFSKDRFVGRTVNSLTFLVQLMDVLIAGEGNPQQV